MEIIGRAGFVVILCCVSFGLFGQQQGIPTVVIEKTVSKAKRAWDVYSDAGMNNVIGSVNPGDSVRVFAWGPWAYQIEASRVAGYISWRAIHITPALRATAEALESKSAMLLQMAAVADSLRKYKDLRFWQPVLDTNALSESPKVINDRKVPSDQSAFLRLYASKTNIDAGECTAVNLSFYVSSLNRLPLQFNDLNNQISKLMEGPLNQPACWYADEWISKVEGVPVRINLTNFTEYRIFSRNYCPVEVKPIEFKEVALTLLTIDQKTKKGTPVVYKSKPVTINVRAASHTGATSTDFFRLTGKFVATDSVYTRYPGSPLVYTVTLKGKGLSFPLQPPTLSGENFTAEFISARDADTVLNNVYYSAKTFAWNLFMKEGTHQLWQRPVFSVYDPADKQVKPVLINRSITVSSGEENYKAAQNKVKPDHFILLDVSQSMMIEDYLPNRLGMVKTGVHDFLTKRSGCNVGLITFSGKASCIDLGNPDGCYQGQLIKQIDFKVERPGTVIGDAMWLGIHSINKTAPLKRIVILGDGENTAGYTNLMRAVTLANKNKVVVYTIGIGKSGLVPFGIDSSGEPLLIGTNFSEVTLKQIAEQTGGKYFHAESAADVTRFLKEILPE